MNLSSLKVPQCWFSAVMNLEDDIATLNIMVANDVRTLNKLVIYKPPMNVISQSEIASLWEKKTRQTLKRVYLLEAEMVKLSESKIKSIHI